MKSLLPASPVPPPGSVPTTSAASSRSSPPATLLITLGALVISLLAAPAAQAEQATSASHRVAAASVASGDNHTCAILTSGRLRCWGDNSRGQLGLGTLEHLGDDEAITSVPPIDLGPGRTAVAVAVSAGGRHTCAILDTGQLRCWGDGGYGQLGTGNSDTIGDDEPITDVPPVDLGAGRTAVAVSAGYRHTCAILDTGQLRCWGDNDQGQLGLGSTDYLGDNESILSQPPVDLGPGRTAVAVSAGRDHTCAILDTGQLRCWGHNDDGQLGLGTSQNLGDAGPITAAAPIDLGPGRTAVAVSASAESHTCAVLDNARLRCWGTNSNGELGLGTTETLGDDEAILTASPVPIGPVRGVVTGRDHTCATLTSGAVRCWGDNGVGQLGLGTTDDLGDDESVTTVAPVNLGRPAVVAVAGLYHSCALLDDARLRCWGDNFIGQLGLGTTIDLGDDEAILSQPALPITVRTRAVTQLSATVKPKRDKKKPYRYRITGQVRGAYAVDDATCSGTVRATTKGKVKARLRGQTKTRRIRVTGSARTQLRRVGRTCTYQMRLTVKPAKKKQAKQVVGKLRGKPRITLRLPATTNLNPATKRIRVRLG